MRDYSQKKREENLRKGKVKTKNIVRNAISPHRAPVANSVLSQASTAEPTTGLPNLVVSHATF